MSIKDMNNKLEVNFSQRIKAPLQFSFEWLTDFREDDPAITNSTSKMKILEKTENSVKYQSERTENGKEIKTLSSVTMTPNTRWDLEAKNNEVSYTGIYQLVPDGEYTRLDIKFVYTYEENNIPTEQEKMGHFKSHWGTLASALENDFNNQ